VPPASLNCGHHAGGTCTKNDYINIHASVLACIL
jgi:hypothetical protein